MEIDRALMREILENVAAARPRAFSIQQVYGRRPDVTNAVEYLCGHELLDAKRFDTFGAQPCYLSARITQKGIDYLTADGGLGAELDVVTVKLHPETLAALIESTPAFRALPEAERSRLSSALRALGSKALESLVKELVVRGLDRTPEALAWLQTVLARLQ